MANQTGWKPIPLPLKILFILFILWALGAVMNAPHLYVSGMPLFGVFVNGGLAIMVVLLLDIIGPIIFLFGLWNRKSWAPLWAYAYISVFILNSLIAFFTVREQLGTPQILVPTIVSILFVLVIYSKRNYFIAGPK